jgi:hypothetical protein
MARCAHARRVGYGERERTAPVCASSASRAPTWSNSVAMACWSSAVRCQSSNSTTPLGWTSTTPPASAMQSKHSGVRQVREAVALVRGKPGVGDRGDQAALQGRGQQDRIVRGGRGGGVRPRLRARPTQRQAVLGTVGGGRCRGGPVGARLTLPERRRLTRLERTHHPVGAAQPQRPAGFVAGPQGLQHVVAPVEPRARLAVGQASGGGDQGTGPAVVPPGLVRAGGAAVRAPARGIPGQPEPGPVAGAPCPASARSRKMCCPGSHAPGPPAASASV